MTNAALAAFLEDEAGICDGGALAAEHDDAEWQETKATMFRQAAAALLREPEPRSAPVPIPGAVPCPHCGSLLNPTPESERGQRLERLRRALDDAPDQGWLLERTERVVSDPVPALLLWWADYLSGVCDGCDLAEDTHATLWVQDLRQLVPGLRAAAGQEPPKEGTT